MIISESIAYERLPGSGRRWGKLTTSSTKCVLWLAPDHLLSVEMDGYTEKYRRFYFKDIQTIQLAPAQTHVLITALAGVLILIFTPIILAIGGDYRALLMLAWLGFMGGVIAVNSARGPSCRAMIRTAVQADQLAAVSRFKQARQILARIVPMIEGAQGGATLPPLEAQARLAEFQRHAMQVSFAGPARGQGMNQGPMTPQPQFSPSPQPPYSTVQPQPSLQHSAPAASSPVNPDSSEPAP